MAEMKIGDFEGFLILGLVILAIMLAVFSFSTAPEPVKKPIAFREIPVFNLSTAVHVGPQQLSAIKTFPFTFDVSNLREAKTVFLGNKTVKNGVLFGEQDVRYGLSIKSPSKLDISFKVVKSSELEPLIIQVNTKTVASDIYVPGEYKIRVDNAFLTDSMLVSMTAASSGWQIWAPNLYELHDVRIDAEGYEEKATNFIFELDQEAKSFTFGKVDLSMTKNIGKLNARLNFNSIYSAPPTNALSFQFRKSDIRQGENILNIVADKDSVFQGRGVATIYYLKEKTQEFRTPLNLTKPEFDQMNHTVIRFNAVNVARPGGLAIKIENRNGITFRDFAAVNGDTRFEFIVRRGEIAPGFNVLAVSSLDSAVFDVTDLDVKLR
ncbi:MAG: hypothetical protein HY514_03825 [Candidatus Aenigmarchaeota archaeon]|nr:hypothetical protein [Candidatus Aenigmarchaeota archaeon]